VSARPPADAPAQSPAIDLEASLEMAFGADPTPRQVEMIDRRVSAVMQAPQPVAILAQRPAHRPRRRWGVALLAAAALVVLVAAGTSLLSMYPIVRSGGYGLAWDRSTKLGISQVHDGYRVTLEAGYADAAQTMLAISIIDTQGGRNGGVMVQDADLTDEAGRTYPLGRGVGAGAPAYDSSSVNMVWFDTPGDGSLSGTHHFVLTMPDIGVRQVAPSFSIRPTGTGVGDPWGSVAGPWRFEFDLAIAPGTVLTPAETATVKGVTATVGSVLVAPTTVRMQLRFDGLPDGGFWAPVGTVEHNGEQLALGVTSISSDPTAWETLTTETGADSASGSWTIRIDELVGGGPEGETRLAGPWTIIFTAP
jgi:hypothetical protein